MTQMSDIQAEFDESSCYLQVMAYTVSHGIFQLTMHRGVALFYKVIECRGLCCFKGVFPGEGGPYRLMVEARTDEDVELIVIRDVTNTVEIVCKAVFILPGTSRPSRSDG